MTLKKFEDFEIWKVSIDLAEKIYKITNQRSFSKDFGLRDQIRRAIVSVSSNIAEGYEMNNNKQFIRFLRITNR
jgi:four helix bundle protein